MIGLLSVGLPADNNSKISGDFFIVNHIDGLSMIIGDKYHQNPFEKEPCFFSVADALTESRDCSGWATDFSCPISVLRQAPCPGRALQKRQLGL